MSDIKKAEDRSGEEGYRRELVEVTAHVVRRSPKVVSAMVLLAEVTD